VVLGHLRVLLGDGFVWNYLQAFRHRLGPVGRLPRASLLKEIGLMRSAGWSSENTFRRYYQRKVTRVEDSVNLAEALCPNSTFVFSLLVNGLSSPM
jgi:hypothetical protein